MGAKTAAGVVAKLARLEEFIQILRSTNRRVSIKVSPSIGYDMELAMSDLSLEQQKSITTIILAKVVQAKEDYTKVALRELGVKLDGK
jgi:hypothetical protein